MDFLRSHFQRKSKSKEIDGAISYHVKQAIFDEDEIVSISGKRKAKYVERTVVFTEDGIKILTTPHEELLFFFPYSQIHDLSSYPIDVQWGFEGFCDARPKRTEYIFKTKQGWQMMATKTEMMARKTKGTTYDSPEPNRGFAYRPPKGAKSKSSSKNTGIEFKLPLSRTKSNMHMDRDYNVGSPKESFQRRSQSHGSISDFMKTRGFMDDSKDGLVLLDEEID